MDRWTANGTVPPPSRYPRLADGTLVAPDRLRFPKVPGITTSTAVHKAYRADYGPTFASDGIVTQEPPRIGKAFPILVPQVDADGDGLAMSKRRITLSTSGVVPNIERAGAEIGCMLAVSLHAVRDELRNELVPLNKKYPIAELLQACRNFPGSSNARRITFEYVMLKGVNDSLDDAKLLVKMLKGIPAKINLIPFNPWPGTRYQCSDWDQIEKFSEYIFNAGYSSPVRTPRGRDILAACGQLKSETEKMSARERQALRAMAMTD